MKLPIATASALKKLLQIIVVDGHSLLSHSSITKNIFEEVSLSFTHSSTNKVFVSLDAFLSNCKVEWFPANKRYLKHLQWSYLLWNTSIIEALYKLCKDKKHWVSFLEFLATEGNVHATLLVSLLSLDLLNETKVDIWGFLLKMVTNKKIPDAGLIEELITYVYEPKDEEERQERLNQCLSAIAQYRGFNTIILFSSMFIDQHSDEDNLVKALRSLNVKTKGDPTGLLTNVLISDILA